MPNRLFAYGDVAFDGFSSFPLGQFLSISFYIILKIAKKRDVSVHCICEIEDFFLSSKHCVYVCAYFHYLWSVLD